ncbi:MAG: hypothetical protein PWR01_3314 [Clostridiales bacterium]|nr:hypothetical protein [Clostridiales bacterium]MDN5282241.1 hypothetical protein [Candidatus Ozemobacter sp.]
MLYRIKIHTNITLLLLLATLVCAFQAQAASRNLLPRIPDIVLEKGFSENFLVTDCKASVKVTENDAQSTLDVSIKNRSPKKIKSSVKFRVLYPTSENQIQVRVNGKTIRYDRKSPRYSFELESQASINFSLSARTNINYSIDGVREALRKEHQDDEANKGKKFDLSGLMKLFEREKFGKRFLVGALVSKWGVFPLEFEKVQLEISVPSDFALVAQEPEKWQSKNSGRNRVFTFTSLDGFDGTVFLPETDREEFVKTQKILNSSEFMH